MSCELQIAESATPSYGVSAAYRAMVWAPRSGQEKIVSVKREKTPEPFWFRLDPTRLGSESFRNMSCELQIAESAAPSYGVSAA